MIRKETATAVSEIESPFKGCLPPPERSVMERLTGKSRPDLAKDAIKATLAEPNQATVSSTTFDTLIHRYGLSETEKRSVQCDTYKAAVGAFLARDGALSDGHRAFLETLRGLLNLGSDEAQRAHVEVITEPFAAAQQSAFLNTDRVGRRADLEAAALGFAFDDSHVRILLIESLRSYANIALAPVLKSRRITQAELETLESDFAALRIALDDAMREKLMYARFCSDAEAGLPLPALTVDVNLVRNELCYGSHTVIWQVGSGARQKLDSGTLYLTDRRIIFNGKTESTAIRYSAILSLSKTTSFSEKNGRSVRDS